MRRTTVICAVVLASAFSVLPQLGQRRNVAMVDVCRISDSKVVAIYENDYDPSKYDWNLMYCYHDFKG